MTLRLSAKQAKHNIESEGGVLAGLLQSAVRFLPSILAGIAAGTAEYHKEGNGMFLGKRDHTYQITHSGEGLVIKPVAHRKIRGFWDRVFELVNGLAPNGGGSTTHQHGKLKIFMEKIFQMTKPFGYSSKI